MEWGKRQASHEYQRRAGTGTGPQREGHVGFSSYKRHQVTQPPTFGNEEDEAGGGSDLFQAACKSRQDSDPNIQFPAHLWLFPQCWQHPSKAPLHGRPCFLQDRRSGGQRSGGGLYPEIRVTTALHISAAQGGALRIAPHVLTH